MPSHFRLLPPIALVPLLLFLVPLLFISLSPLESPAVEYWWDGFGSYGGTTGLGQGEVTAMTVYQGELIVGGYFDTAGGVSANQKLREACNSKLSIPNFKFPTKLEYCTDNAAMIAGAAYFLQSVKPGAMMDGKKVEVYSQLPL